MPIVPPPGDRTAQATPTPEGDVVALGPTGCGRIFIVGFLLVWLTGWLAGELLALAALLAIGGILPDLPLPAGMKGFKIPPGPAALPIAGFLLFWLVLWTIGGAAAIREVLRQLFGADRFLLMPGGFEVRRRPFGRTLRLERGGVDFLSLKHQAGALVAESGSKTTELTSLGTLADRRWLRDLLRERYGLPAERPGSTAASRTQGAPPLPDGWESERSPLGELLVMPSRKRARQAAGCAAVLALLVAGGVVAYLLTSATLLTGILPGLFALLAILGALWCVLAREVWVVRRGSIEIRRTFPGWSRITPLTAGALVIVHSRDSDGDDWFELRVASPAGSRKLTNFMNDARSAVALGRFLAVETAWELQVPPEAREG